MARQFAHAITNFFESPWFDHTWKARIRVCQLILIIITIVLTGVRINTMNGAPTRSVTLPIVMVIAVIFYPTTHPLTRFYLQGIKSLVVLSYQIVTTHIDRFKKWRSLKAYAILNCLEIMFWFVVVILSFMGVTSTCVGTSCAMASLVSILSLVLT